MRATTPPALVHVLALLSFLAPGLAAQIEHGGRPPSERGVLVGSAGEVPTTTLPPVPVADLLARDAARTTPGPYVFGETVPVELGLERGGTWEELGGGARVWRARVSSPGAFSLSLIFSRFQLPVGAELFVYNDAGFEPRTVRGAYTWLNNKANGEFAIQPIAGSALTLEYFEPAGVERPGELSLSGVVHDYRDVLRILDGGDGDDEDASAPCLVNVACPAGDPWRDQINSALQVISGGALCSGAMVNNTAGDGDQLFLSAAHCGSMTNAVFRFNYQRPKCSGGTAPTNQTVQGAVQLATSTGWDFRLMRITPAIPASYGARLTGWDRRKNTGTSKVVGVSHPDGNVKRISISNQAPSRSSIYWQVLQWHVGQTKPGSSGSPLYTDLGRQIGVLSVGGQSSCGEPSIDGYGRLDGFWDQVAAYLDPAATGVTRLDGMDPFPSMISEVDPLVVEALDPGTAKSVSIHGANFPPYAKVLIDGVEIAASRVQRVGTTRFDVDLPQVAQLGMVTLTVQDGSDVASTTIEIVEPDTPKLELGNGNPLNSVSQPAGLPIVVAGKVGSLQIVYGSLSNLPSVNMFVSMAIGDNFTSLFRAGSYSMPGAAWVQDQATIPPSAIGQTFYAQSIAFDGSGKPFPVSNVQSFTIVP